MVVLDVDDHHALLHDPQGYPYVRLPLDDFMNAWRDESISYGEPYTMRTRFTRVAEISDEDAIRATIPATVRWLSIDEDFAMPHGSLGNGSAAEELANLLESGSDTDLHEHLIHFAIRVGARRAADAATCLARVGNTEASLIAAEQSKLIGSMQHPLITGNSTAVAAGLRTLSPTYERLRMALASQL